MRRGSVAGAVDALSRRDEILELLFWMRGQGFAQALTIAGLARFLTCSEAESAEGLAVLLRAGAVRREGKYYSLTEAGLPEARRRFLDDFRTMLAEGHGECNFSCLHDDPGNGAK